MNVGSTFELANRTGLWVFCGPMPRGNRPSTAAFTSSGARNASEIVILTCRVLQPPRLLSDNGSSYISDDCCATALNVSATLADVVGGINEAAHLIFVPGLDPNQITRTSQRASIHLSIPKPTLTYWRIWNRISNVFRNTH